MKKAFFSGTDNANDRMSICYSGVIGKLTPDNYEYVFRFNLYENKKEAELSDVFEMPEKPVAVVPKDWLTQVDVKTQTSNPKDTLANRMAKHFKNQVKDKDQKQGNVFEDEDLGSEQSLWDRQVSGFGSYIPDEIYINPQTGTTEVRKTSEDLEDEDLDSKPISKGKKKKTPDNESELIGLTLGEGDEFAYNASQYGVEAAEARDQIDAYLTDLTDTPELVLDVLRSCYDLLDDTCRSELATNGF